MCTTKQDSNRETREKVILTNETEQKVRTFRCPFIGNGNSALRAVHPKSHGVVNAQFYVNKDLPESFRIGIFRKEQTFKALCRFSSSGGIEGRVYNDEIPDIRGLAIKLLDTEDVSIQDFLFVTLPVFGTNNALETIPRSGFDNIEKYGWNPFFKRYEEKLGSKSNLASRMYYSQSPYLFGSNKVIRYLLIPSSNTPITSELDLTKSLAHILVKNDVEFSFAVQFQEDPKKQMIDDLTSEWDTPHYIIAKLIIPKQVLQFQNEDKKSESLVFSPWNSQPDHAPIGYMGRVSRSVYKASADTRNRLNGTQDPFPFKVKPLNVCIVGGGAAGMSAALALSTFGHKVTIIEREKTVGGHACSVDIGSGHSVDPAFGAFLEILYPNFLSLLKLLQLEYERVGWFSQVSTYYTKDRELEWRNLQNIPLSFAKGVLEEIKRFKPIEIMNDKSLDNVTAREYFKLHGYSNEFLHYVFLGTIIYFFPGNSLSHYLDYPIRTLIACSFFPGIMTGDKPLCRLKNGSGAYSKVFRKFLEQKGVKFCLSSNAKVLKRTEGEVQLAINEEVFDFDHLIMAVGPWESLKILGEKASTDEKKVLGSFQSTRGTIVLHQDESILPKNKNNITYGNIVVPSNSSELTEDCIFTATKMTLCNNDRKTQVYATHSYGQNVDIVDGKRVSFTHVKVTPETLKLRKEVKRLQGNYRTWYCGSWLRGLTLHEDALVTGFKVANKIMGGITEFPILKSNKSWNSETVSKPVYLNDCETILDNLEYHAREKSDLFVYRFVNEKGIEVDSLTFAELNNQSGRIAELLHDEYGVKKGDRVLLVFFPGIEFIVAFFACLKIGAIAVPAYPPLSNESIPILLHVINNAQCSVAFASKDLIEFSPLASIVPQVKWYHITEEKKKPMARQVSFKAKKEDVAFLQYTSGSTSDPKGVTITHGNIVHQMDLCARSLGFRERGIGVMWCPQYHDLGLITGIVAASYHGGTCVFTSPITFVQSPALFCELLSRYKAQFTCGPDFGYKLMIKKTTNEQRAKWDFSHLEVVMSAGDVVHPETVTNFIEAFRISGLNPKAFVAGYGLAEHCCGAIISGRTYLHVNTTELELTHRVVPGSTVLSSCGQSEPDVHVAIVDPKTKRRMNRLSVGEIWIYSPSVALGYWGNAELTESVFGATIEGEEDMKYLRTGDFGFLDDNGRIYVTGRLKDLIIICGVNVYPQDIEKSIDFASSFIRPGCSIACGIQIEDHEALGVIAEVTMKSLSKNELSSIAKSIRAEVMKRNGLKVEKISLIEPGTILKTTSGKLRRKACQSQWQSGQLKTLFSDCVTTDFEYLRIEPGTVSLGQIVRDIIFAVTRMKYEDDSPIQMDSLAAVQVIGMIQMRTQVSIPASLFATEAPTIRTIIQYLENQKGNLRILDSRIVNINNRKEDQGLFLMHPVDGGVASLLELGRNLTVPTFAIRQNSKYSSIEKQATSYIQALKSVQANGPYLLGGYSFGAIVAQEMAIQLLESGEVVSGVINIDELFTNWKSFGEAPFSYQASCALIIAKKFLSTEEMEKLRNSLDIDSSLQSVLEKIEDQQIREQVQIQCEFMTSNIDNSLNWRNKKKVINFDMVLYYTKSSDAANQIECKEKYEIQGEHFTVTQRPHVEILASKMNQWILDSKIQAPSRISRREKSLNLHGKIAIVTGANSGIGKEVTMLLAASGARVIMGCRNLSLAQQAALDIREKVTDAKLEIIQLELDSFDSVRNFVDVFKRLELPLHILVHCAGVFASEKLKTKDGFELQLQVNQLSPFILNQLLLPCAPSRIVYSTRYHGNSPQSLRLEDLNGDNEKDPEILYEISKVANLSTVREFARRHNKDNIKALAASPGPLVDPYATRFFRNATEKQKQLMMFESPIPLDIAAKTVFYAASNEELNVNSGDYLFKSEVIPLEESKVEKEDSKRLWDICMNIFLKVAQ